jgi:hypothetical protein
MSEIVEHIAELRRMASRFRGLIAYPGKHAFQHYMLLRDHGDELLDKVWDAGFLRSIQGAERFAKLNKTYVEEIGCYLDAFLFSNIVGFGLEYFTIKGCRFISPGLLNQAPVTIGMHAEKELNQVKQLFTLDNLIALRDELSKALESTRINEENHFSECTLSHALVDSSTWAEAMDLFGFELFERNARGCEMLIEIIEREFASKKSLESENGDQNGNSATDVEFPKDGVYRESKLVIWGGRRFECLTRGQIEVIYLLHDRYKKGLPDVNLKDIKRIAKVQTNNGFKQNVFKLNRKSGPRIHPVECIVAQSTRDSYRLIDPRNVPKSS